MSRNRVAWLVLALIVSLTLACINSGCVSALPTGEAAPNFGIKLGTQTVSLNDLQGKVVIVNFWSST